MPDEAGAIQSITLRGSGRQAAAAVSTGRNVPQRRELPFRQHELVFPYRAWHEMGETKRVLFVDDDVDFLAAIPRRCRQLGIGVGTARKALTGLSLIETQRVDLICISGALLAADGQDPPEPVPAHPLCSRTPIVALTETGDEEVVRRCHELGAHCVARGPDTWQRLEPLLVELLGLKAPARGQGKPIYRTDHPVASCGG